MTRPKSKPWQGTRAVALLQFAVEGNELESVAGGVWIRRGVIINLFFLSRGRRGNEWRARTGAQMHAEFRNREAEFVARQQGAARHSLAIDFRSIGTAQIADKQQAISLCNHTMQL